VLVVGATGSGKSTSLVSLLGDGNENSCRDLLTIED
jgi:Tfp pilus assembly ATPase PilU